MRLISWNVNGLRAVIKAGFGEFLAAQSPDVLCLQEIKARPDQLAFDWGDYFVIWNPATRPGYSGTLVATRIPPLSIVCNTGIAEGDAEGRVITLEFATYHLVNVYTPNSKRDLARLDYRATVWDKGFLKYCRTLERTKPVIFCGDLNAAHTEIDLARPKDNRRNAGFTDEERAGIDAYIGAGFIDTFRHFHPDTVDRYTWWSYMNNARERNIGWRIDYAFASGALRDRLVAADIIDRIPGSDHCPVMLEADV